LLGLFFISLSKLKKNIITSYKLFLDDFRVPSDVYSYKHLDIYLNNDWFIVRNYDEFINHIIKNGIPNTISFDHDLSGEHYGGQTIDTIINYDEYKNKTGYHCAKWLIDYVLEEELEPPHEIYIHSMNPAGSENIKKLWVDFNILKKMVLIHQILC